MIFGGLWKMWLDSHAVRKYAVSQVMTKGWSFSTKTAIDVENNIIKKLKNMDGKNISYGIKKSVKYGFINKRMFDIYNELVKKYHSNFNLSDLVLILQSYALCKERNFEIYSTITNRALYLFKGELIKYDSSTFDNIYKYILASNQLNYTDYELITIFLKIIKKNLEYYGMKKICNMLHALSKLKINDEELLQLSSIYILENFDKMKINFVNHLVSAYCKKTNKNFSELCFKLIKYIYENIKFMDSISIYNTVIQIKHIIEKVKEDKRYSTYLFDERIEQVIGGNTSNERSQSCRSVSHCNNNSGNIGSSDNSGSNSSGSNSSGNNSSGSNSSGSNSSGNNISGSNISGSNISGSNISGSNINGSKSSGYNNSGNSVSGDRQKCQMGEPRAEINENSFLYSGTNGAEISAQNGGKEHIVYGVNLEDKCYLNGNNKSCSEVNNDTHRNKNIVKNMIPLLFSKVNSCLAFLSLKQLVKLLQAYRDLNYFNYQFIYKRLLHFLFCKLQTNKTNVEDCILILEFFTILPYVDKNMEGVINIVMENLEKDLVFNYSHMYRLLSCCKQLEIYNDNILSKMDCLIFKNKKKFEKYSTSKDLNLFLHFYNKNLQEWEEMLTFLNILLERKEKELKENINDEHVSSFATLVGENERNISGIQNAEKKVIIYKYNKMQKCFNENEKSVYDKNNTEEGTTPLLEDYYSSSSLSNTKGVNENITNYLYINLIKDKQAP
ncbi:conserved Plasmodium protein, unknown function [Plasmodium malariae]|uniref:Uncharacterized protein n=1 Tax=Plasmodium malariae TaxID=5858 RepID=A0A1A8X994_PLAMA|nr:conserved Plasmodium protein, unknown function [Plasmodium malariae]